MKAFVSAMVNHSGNRPMAVLEAGDRIYLDRGGLLTVVEAGASKPSYATMRCGASYIRRGYIPLWKMNDKGEMIAGGGIVDLVGIRTVAAVGRLCEEQERGTAGPEDAARLFETAEEALAWLRQSAYGEPDGAFVIDVPTDDPRFRTDPLPGVSEETLRLLLEPGRAASDAVFSLDHDLSYSLAVDGYNLGEWTGYWRSGDGSQKAFKDQLTRFELPADPLHGRIAQFFLQRAMKDGPCPWAEARFYFPFLDTYHRPVSALFKGQMRWREPEHLDVLAASVRQMMMGNLREPDLHDGLMPHLLHQAYGNCNRPLPSSVKDLPEVQLAHLADFGKLAASATGPNGNKHSDLFDMLERYLILFNRTLYIPGDPVIALFMMQVWQVWMQNHPSAFVAPNRNRFAFYLLYLHLYRLRFPTYLLRDDILQRWRAIPSAVKEHRAATFRRRLAEHFSPRGV